MGITKSEKTLNGNEIVLIARLIRERYRYYESIEKAYDLVFVAKAVKSCQISQK